MDDQIVLKFEKEYKEKLKHSKQKVTGLTTWNFKHMLTWPFVYGMIFPLFTLDISVRIYQAICFPLFGISKVIRSDYFYPKRNRLKYLNVIEKLNCDYCGYGNGLIAFTREVFARTEQYWCPIRHSIKIVGEHDRYRNFLKYGDSEDYQNKLEIFRKELLIREEV